MTKKYILKIAFIYTATILGAGFASGKELINFFGFYDKGYLGFFISCIFMVLIGSCTLNTIYKSKAKTYEQFMKENFLYLGKPLAYFNLSFIFVIFSSMLAGGSEALSSLLNLNYLICLIIFFFIIFIFLNLNKNIILNINALLCPILILGSFLVGLYLTFYTKSVFNNSIKMISYPVIYASYNTITTISILFALKKFILNKKVVIYSGVLGGFFIFLIGIFLLLPLINNYNILKNIALPILYMLDDKFILRFLYSFVILLAIFTTAISNGFALCDNLNIDKILLKAFLVFLGAMFSLCSFSKIVAIIYPIFGIIGIFEILVIIISCFIKIKNT